MIATIVYARNPRQPNPIEGFTSFAPSAAHAQRRLQQLQRDIASGQWRTWTGESRRHFVARAQRNGWAIEVKQAVIV